MPGPYAGVNIEVNGGSFQANCEGIDDNLCDHYSAVVFSEATMSHSNKMLATNVADSNQKKNYLDVSIPNGSYKMSLLECYPYVNI